MSSVDVLFTCGCWERRTLKHVKAYGAVCGIHGRPMERYNPKEWRVRCHRCSYGRWFSQDVTASLRAQARHCQAHPSHEVAREYDTVTEDGRGMLLAWNRDTKLERYPRRRQSWSSGEPARDLDGPIPF